MEQGPLHDRKLSCTEMACPMHTRQFKNIAKLALWRLFYLYSGYPPLLSMTAMNNATESPKTSSASPVNYLRHYWLNFRKKRFWILVLFLLYTLAGFFLVPHLVQKKLTQLLNTDLGRQAQVEKVEFNPFILSLRIQGFDLDDKDQARLASFKQFFVNFQLSSLFNRAWTFDEISLDQPYFFVERFNSTDSRTGNH
jgi:hypothetical protein